MIKKLLINVVAILKKFDCFWMRKTVKLIKFKCELPLKRRNLMIFTTKTIQEIVISFQN